MRIYAQYLQIPLKPPLAVSWPGSLPVKPPQLHPNHTESPFKHACWSAAPPIRQRCSLLGLATQTIAPQIVHSEARRFSETGYHTSRMWPASLAVDSHLATITDNCSLRFI